MVKRIVFIIIAIVLLVIVVVGVNQFFVVRKAHSTFENYYAFRGCTQLIKKTSTYGLCKTASGQTIKIVQVGGKWYLDGDLPVCYFRWCF